MSGDGEGINNSEMCRHYEAYLTQVYIPLNVADYLPQGIHL
jgi:hypothetical protein